MNPAIEFCLYLWKPTKEAGGVRFIHFADLPESGFASAYAVRADVASALENAKTTTGFKGVVWSPSLWLDCDTAEASQVVEGRLKEKGLAYSKYTTGNRGAHFELTRLSEPSHLLPGLDRLWVAKYFPEADQSLYTHLHLLRRVGATHEKTGEKKVLVEAHDGEVITAEDYAEFRANPKVLAVVESTPSELECVFLDPVIMSRTVPYDSGSRHKAFCAVAARMQERGQPLSFVETWLLNMNLLCVPTLPEGEVRRIAAWAYNRR